MGGTHASLDSDQLSPSSRIGTLFGAAVHSDGTVRNG
jgi:hypothetical protein